MTAPKLVLIGAADDLNRAEACREMARLPHPDGAEIEVVVYPGTYHVFDVNWFQPGRGVDELEDFRCRPALAQVGGGLGGKVATKLSPGRLDEALDAIKQTVVSRSSFRGGRARDMSQP